jgi:hypothetical protein
MTRAVDLPFVELDTRFVDKPMTNAHWGRLPINAGQRVSINLPARAVV